MKNVSGTRHRWMEKLQLHFCKDYTLEKFSSRTIEIVGCTSGLWYIIL